MESYLIDNASEIDPAWIVGKQHIGLTAGASAPQVLVDGVLARLRELGASGVSELEGEPESMVFALPRNCGCVWSADAAPLVRPRRLPRLTRGGCAPTIHGSPE